MLKKFTSIDNVYKGGRWHRPSSRPPLRRRKHRRALPVYARYHPPAMLGAHLPACMVSLWPDELTTARQPQAHPHADAIRAHERQAVDAGAHFDHSRR